MSKYQREEPGALRKHKHCPICGTPIEMNKEFCSDKCRLQGRKTARSRTRTFLLITVAIIVFYVIFIIVNFKL